MKTYDYDVISEINARYSPNTLKCKNNTLYRFFVRYLWQKAMSIFDFTLPEEWEENYFKAVLYAAGYIAVLDTEEYGVIPQYCTFNGKRTVFYQPAGILVTNPAFKGSRTYEKTIGIDCELIKLTPDYFGIGDIIGYFGDQLALSAEAIGINILNTKTAYVFASENKTAAETFKKMFDAISRGEPAVFLDNKLYRDDGEPAWVLFQQDLKNMYITPELLQTMADLEAQFDAFIGLPNTNGVEKKERLITDEVNMNNITTYARAEVWKDNIDAGIEKVNKMFDLDLKCEWKHEPPAAAAPIRQDVNTEVDV